MWFQRNSRDGNSSNLTQIWFHLDLMMNWLDLEFSRQDHCDLLNKLSVRTHSPYSSAAAELNTCLDLKFVCNNIHFWSTVIHYKLFIFGDIHLRVISHLFCLQTTAVFSWLWDGVIQTLFCDLCVKRGMTSWKPLVGWLAASLHNCDIIFCSDHIKGVASCLQR